MDLGKQSFWFGKGWLVRLFTALTMGLYVAFAVGDPLLPQNRPPPDPLPEMPANFKTPEVWAQSYVALNNWAALDALVERLAASGERADDGRFQLYKLTAALSDWLESHGEEKDEDFRIKFAEYGKQIPQSAFQPILVAMQIHAAAWRVRGHGFTSTVSPEGWSLFRERNREAWKTILAAKPRSDRLPTWYDRAISIGMDANIPDEQLTAIFEEGIEKFPGNYAIYFAYARQLSPRWGGTYEDADAFIQAQVSAKTNPDGDVLYTRLYWLIDQNNGQDQDFFEESLVDWSRMRGGFELLMKQFPKSAWNKANFTAYACRARDAASYLKLRPEVDPHEFDKATPWGISLEVCDARFTVKT
jgi:hypothetical protein